MTLPFGIDFRAHEIERKFFRDERPQMDPIEAEKQERRLLRMMKNGVSRAQFAEMDVPMARVEAVARKHGHDLSQNIEKPWRTPVHKMKPLHQLKRGRR